MIAIRNGDDEIYFDNRTPTPEICSYLSHVGGEMSHGLNELEKLIG